MRGPDRFHNPEKRSSVLIFTLMIVVLVTIVVLGLLTSITLEKQMIESNFQQHRANGVAVLAFQSGVAQLRQALGTGTNSWDDPYANFSSNAPTFFWSVSPGVVTRWSYASSSSLTNIPLFSQTSDSANTNLFNLNQPFLDGTHPIIGGANPPNVSVQMVNLLQNPSFSASAGNPIVARYAFWIDDENAKININVADGTQKYTTNSLGIGSPTEVSLQVLSQGGTPLSPSQAQSIVQMARTNSFHSPREILRASGTTADLYTNNLFYLTDYSRSPDLNIFGQPKMAVLPVLGDPNASGSDMVINGITLLPEKEIYPTPSQLPAYKVVDPVDGSINVDPWPLAFRAEAMTTTGRNLQMYNDDALYSYGSKNYAYNNGALLANYLAGTNAAGTPISWPVFPTSSSQGFIGKYSKRQIDSIAIQIVSLGSKLISSDYPYPLSTDYPANNIFDPGNYAADDNSDVTSPTGFRYNVSPFIFPGWLSKQWVIGMGRAPKVTRMAVRVKTFGSQGTVGSTTDVYKPPQALVDIWLEEWIPGAYRGGNAVVPLSHGNTELPGAQSLGYFKTAVNVADIGVIPKSDITKPSYWANQMLTNNQGIDFNNNPSYTYPSIPSEDPDQDLAHTYHDPWAWTNTPPEYLGAGPVAFPGAPNYAGSPFVMYPMQDTSPTTEWAAGEMRCSTSYDIFPSSLSMQTSADSGTLTIGGGISVHGQMEAPIFSEPDPVPLETIRGPDSSQGILTGDHVLDNAWTNTTGMTGSPPGSTVRDRNLASVIPVNISVTVPAHGDTSGGNSAFFFAQPADPLVNKFPGDWISTPAIPTVAQFPGMNTPTDPGGTISYSESSYLSSLQDPQSFWVPQADCAYSTKDKLASQTLIPRSARMPNIGYLQYVRTGIIPDDESLPYSPQPGQTPSQYQHGTPFRLLDFAPSGDSSQVTTYAGSQSYPDWALLDLLYVPSILNSYGGPYAAYTNLAPFGTFGGATAGRINPNGSVIYTTNATIPQPNVSRILPLQATLLGVSVNQTFNGTASNPAIWPYTGGTTLDSGGSATLAQAIADYIRAKGPLRMPAEICNIPAVATLGAGTSVNATRNDLVRQVVGELTTQSNVFSVWTVGQVVQKVPGNVQYGEFEPGDLVLAEVRLHFVVERYLDPGADGIYGNSTNPGHDNAVGSFDDPVDPASHPFEPKYLYRIIRSEEVR